MRGYVDLSAEMKPRAPLVRRAVCETGMTLDRGELRGASMLNLCPGAFDGFFAYKPPPEPPADTPAMKLLDPAQRLKGATEVDETTARARSANHPQRVLSIVITDGGAGAQAYGSVAVKVVVPGYRPNAEAYYLSGS